MLSTSLTPPGTSSARPSYRRIFTSVPFLLFGFFASVYALTSAGRLDSADGVVVALTAQSLLLHHTVALPSATPDAVIGVGGAGYSIYGIAQSLVEIPFVAAGLLLRLLTRQDGMVEWTIAFTNALVTALGCVVFFLLARRLGASQRRGIALTLIYGLCTLAWPYAKTDFNEPLQTLSLLLAAYAVPRAHEEPDRPRWLWAAGSALGLAVLTKSALLVTVPAFMLSVASASLLGTKRRELFHLVRKAYWWEAVLQQQARLLAPVALAVAVTLWLNVVRFGSPLDNGYTRAVSGASLIGPLPWGLFTGAFGLLFSFNTGIVFYSTPVLLGFVGLRRFMRSHPPEALLIGTLAVALLVLYSAYRYWAGLAAYGPRYLVPLIPFLLLPAVDAFPGLWTRRRVEPWAVAIVAMVALIGFFEQALGVLVSFGAYSVLTCLQTPCPASLDASQSEILYDVWLLPASLAYNLFGQPPHVVLGSYPFGAAPVGRAHWQDGLLYGMRYFWFVFLPHSKAFLALGLGVCGVPIVSCLARLTRASGLIGVWPQREATSPVTELVSVGVGVTTGGRAEQETPP